ncbi:MAG: glutathione S-transferase family protein [Pikeienuella sp.]
MLPQPIRLYDQRRAPNPRRLALFLAEKGLEIPAVQIDLMTGAHKAPDFLGVVGWPTVPAVALSDGTVLTETIAICRYLEALHPEPNLMGRDALETAEIEMWERRIEHGLFRSVVAAFRHTNPKMAALETQIGAWGELNRARIDDHLRALDNQLVGRDWIAADRVSIADITAFVAVDFRRILRHPLPEDVPALTAWLDRMAARPGIMEERA